MVLRARAGPKELDQFAPAGDVLELACGTGLWTIELANHANAIIAVDASPEVLAINRSRLREAHPETPVRYVWADRFDWRPEGAYDVVFFGFWLSHVPPRRFTVFWELVRSALGSGGRAFFVDSLRAETPVEKARDQTSVDYTTLRRFNDGRVFEIGKIFYDPANFEARLADVGWRFSVQRTENHLLYGFGEPLS